MKAHRIEYVLFIIGMVIELFLALTGYGDMMPAALGGGFLLIAIIVGFINRAKQKRQASEVLKQDNEIFL